MITEKTISKMLFTLHTVNVSKETPDTNMGLASFEGTDNLRQYDVIKTMRFLVGTPSVKKFICFYLILYTIAVTFQYNTKNSLGGTPDTTFKDKTCLL